MLSGAGLGRLFRVSAVSWAVCLPAATLAVAGGLHVAYPGAAAIYALAAVVCHQLPERSFHLAGVALPVCARCTGIYVGAAAMALCGRATAARARHATADEPHVRWWLAASAVPTGLTLVFEWTTGVMPGHWLRAASGLPLGLAVAWLVSRATRDRVALR